MYVSCSVVFVSRWAARLNAPSVPSRCHTRATRRFTFSLFVHPHVPMDRIRIGHPTSSRARIKRLRRMWRVRQEVAQLFSNVHYPTRAATAELTRPGCSDVAGVALGTRGSGCMIVPNIMPSADVPAALQAVRSAPTPTVLFNTTTVDQLEAEGECGDRSRLAGPLQADGAGEKAITDAMSRASQMPGLAFTPGFVVREPSALVSLPGAPQQLTHANGPSRMIGRDSPATVSALLAVQYNKRLVVFPSLRECLCTPWGPVVAPFVVSVPQGSFLLIRGDLVHCGASNDGAEEHRRVHFFAHRSDEPTSKWANMAVHASPRR